MECQSHGGRFLRIWRKRFRSVLIVAALTFRWTRGWLNAISVRGRVGTMRYAKSHEANVMRSFSWWPVFSPFIVRDTNRSQSAALRYEASSERAVSRSGVLSMDSPATSSAISSDCSLGAGRFRCCAGRRYPSDAQVPRSVSWQRSEQNGRQGLAFHVVG